MKNLTQIDELKNRYFGEIGSPEREQFERESENFRLGVMIQEARKKKGLTQEELAEKTGTSKAYISKIENNKNEVRFSTLKRIVETGLGGRLNISFDAVI
jgi:Predicted transcriptional regulator with C-terminal CBS domains